MGQKPSCVPCASAGQYRTYGDVPAPYRQSLGERRSQDPALLPQDRDQGFPLHASDGSITQDRSMRRLTLPTTEAVFPLAPRAACPP